ncbi:MAG TPA: transglutaminase domain-containing protein [Chitinophagaceae bacterium]
MKSITTIVFLIFVVSGFAQHQPNDPASLARGIVAPYKTEKDKVTAIFAWITDNIAYFRPQAKNSRKNKAGIMQPETFFDENFPLPSLTDRVAANVLQNRRAVCDGYARLFQSLCNHAGIKSQVITGYARTKWEGPDPRFKSNHTWNAVCIDSVWWLLDVTWASGYIARSTGEFVRQYDDYYFLSTPEKFIEHHFPDDQRWTLMNNPPPIQEFRHTPFRQKSFNKYGITSFSPAKGVIETRLGDTIHLTLELAQVSGAKPVAADSLWEEILISDNTSFAFVQPQSSEQSKVNYEFAVNSRDLQWLYVMYNNDAVLRYRVNIKKDITEQ